VSFRVRGTWLGGLLLAAVAGVVVIALLVGRGSGFAVPSFALPSVPGGPAAGGSVASSASPATIGPRHVWLIVMENRSYGQVIGAADAPFLNAFAARYGLATDYHAVARPSLPNYLALISGSTQGVTDDGLHDLAAKSLFDQLDAAGLSWRVFAENVPPGCYLGAAARGGPDGAGVYARKHEPAISFTSVSRNPARCGRIEPLSSFTPAAADFSLVIPNLCHDMHDCSTRVGDTWLAGFVPRVLNSEAFAKGGLLVIAFDEASGKDTSQHTALLFAGRNIAPGTRATAPSSHYGLLHTIQAIFGLECLAQSCNATPIPDLLGG
jgi:phosphatidylinositol-3-phosphatase